MTKQIKPIYQYGRLIGYETVEILTEDEVKEKYPKEWKKYKVNN